MTSSGLASYRAPREWGDGASDSRLHVITDISYAADSIVCRCGGLVTGITDGAAWTDHGGKLFVGGFERSDPHEDPSSEERSARAMVALLSVVRSCTCTSSAVEDCPNYVLGDEEEDDHDEEE